MLYGEIKITIKPGFFSWDHTYSMDYQWNKFLYIPWKKPWFAMGFYWVFGTKEFLSFLGHRNPTEHWRLFLSLECKEIRQNVRKFHRLSIYVVNSIDWCGRLMEFRPWFFHEIPFREERMGTLWIFHYVFHGVFSLLLHITFFVANVSVSYHLRALVMSLLLVKCWRAINSREWNFIAD